MNPDLINFEGGKVNIYLEVVENRFETYSNYYGEYKEDRKLFSNFKKEVNVVGNPMLVDKKLSTIKAEFEERVRKAANKLNLNGITPHSARKYYCHSIYREFKVSDEKETDNFLRSLADKYEKTFRKELNRINSKREIVNN